MCSGRWRARNDAAYFVLSYYSMEMHAILFANPVILSNFANKIYISMEKEFSCISEIREIRRMKSVLSERETRLSRPMLCDYAMIPALYAWFNEIMDGDEGGQPGKAYARMKFIFIILFLYAPGALAGGKMPDGLRAAIARTIPGISPCVISNNKKTSTFYYDVYNRYKEELRDIYDKLVRRMRDCAKSEQPGACSGKGGGGRGREKDYPYLWGDY